MSNKINMACFQTIKYSVQNKGGPVGLAPSINSLDPRKALKQHLKGISFIYITYINVCMSVCVYVYNNNK